MTKGEKKKKHGLKEKEREGTFLLSFQWKQKRETGRCCDRQGRANGKEEKRVNRPVTKKKKGRNPSAESGLGKKKKGKKKKGERGACVSTTTGASEEGSIPLGWEKKR